MLTVLAGLSGRVSSFSALNAKVPIGNVLRRNRLFPLHGLSLLLHLQIAENGHEKQEHNESHATADYQTQTSCQETADTTDVAHRRTIAADYRVRRFQGLHFGATTRRRICHLHIRRRLECFVVREVKLVHRVFFETLAHPVAQAKYADQIPSVWREL